MQFRLFLRTILKDFEVYVLKIATLSIAFACAIVVILFCHHEFGFDRSYGGADSVFRVVMKHTKFDFEGNRLTDRIPAKIYPAVANDNSMVLARCKVMRQQRVLAGGIERELIIHAADSQLTRVLELHVNEKVSAQTDAVLPIEVPKRQGTRDALLSESQSLSLFSEKNSRGKKFSIIFESDTLHFQVAGVFKDLPPNSHTAFNLIIPFEPKLMLKLGVDPNDAALYGRSVGQSLESIHKTINAAAVAKGEEIDYQLQPLKEIHFGRRVVGESALHGDSYSMIILVCIASLMAILALTNFVNLTTLTLPRRSGEIAIRKVAGARRSGILFGFSLEWTMVTVLSMLLAAILIESFSGFIRSVLPIALGDLLQSGIGILTLIIPLLLIAAIAGPVMIANRFVIAPPSRLLSSDKITFPKFRRIISVFQLGISLSLIVASMVVRSQITYSLVKEPGRNKDQIIYLPMPANFTQKDLRKLEILWRSNPNIEGLTAVSHLPNQITRKLIHSEFYELITGYNFQSLFRYPLDSGRWFGPHDTTAVLVNHRGAMFKDRAFEGQVGKAPEGQKVIGVIADLGGPYDLPEKPVIIREGKATDYNFICVRVIEVDIRQTVDYIEQHFNLKPGTVRYMDTKFETWLTYENQLGNLCGMLALVSGLIAGCSIYGLSLTLGNERIKQVAIHKIMGASFGNIILLLMNSFAMPLLVATMAFGIVTYIGLKEWLRNFVYQTHFGVTEGLIAFTFCVFIIVLTSLRQARKLAGRNLIGQLK